MALPLAPLLEQLKALAARPLSQASAPPKDLYVRPEIHDLEQQRIFARSWLCAGRAD